MAEGKGGCPCELLKNIRAEPGLPAPASGEELVVFRLVLPTNLGTKRGTEKTGFTQRAEAGSERAVVEEGGAGGVLELGLDPDAAGGWRVGA